MESDIFWDGVFTGRRFKRSVFQSTVESPATTDLFLDEANRHPMPFT